MNGGEQPKDNDKQPEPEITAEAKETLPFQGKAEALYQGDFIQISVAILIMANFLGNMIKNQIDPGQPPKYGPTFKAMDDLFNVIFLGELILNMYGHWFKKFFSSAWNVFDTSVVIIGCFDLLGLTLPSPLHLLRLLRAFRVFRLFKRIESLNKIIVSLAHSVPGVVNAFSILLLVMCIYAVLATECFREVYMADCAEDGKAGKLGETPASITGRNMCNGQDYYGNFSRSLYTLFQVLTGESWSEMVVRPVLHYYNSRGDKASLIGASIFFVSFILVNAFVLINVVVAVLLDGMAAAGPPEEEPASKPPVSDAVALTEEVRALRGDVATLLDTFKMQLDQRMKKETVLHTADI